MARALSRGGARLRAGPGRFMGGGGGRLGSWGRKTGTVSPAESFSGYAVRHLKPEVTQNWRVRRALCRPVPRGRAG